MARKPAKKKRADHQQLARKVLDAVMPDADSKAAPEKNPAAVTLGRLGGLKGGKARAAKAHAGKTQGDREKGCGEALGAFGLSVFWPA